MNRKGPPNRDRSFGITVGIVLCLIAGYSLWRGHILRAEIVGGIGVFLLTFGIVYPPLLKWPSAAWWKLAAILGFINARILLTLMFTLVLVPVSAVWRLTGKDPLARRRGQWNGWAPYPARYRNKQHYQRMY
jgi:hypothetical protein